MSWQARPPNIRHQAYDACEAVEVILHMFRLTGHLTQLHDVVQEYHALKNLIWEETNVVRPKEGYQDTRPPSGASSSQQGGRENMRCSANTAQSSEFDEGQGNRSEMETDSPPLTVYMSEIQRGEPDE